MIFLSAVHADCDTKLLCGFACWTFFTCVCVCVW